MMKIWNRREDDVLTCSVPKYSTRFHRSIRIRSNIKGEVLYRVGIRPVDLGGPLANQVVEPASPNDQICLHGAKETFWQAYQLFCGQGDGKGCIFLYHFLIQLFSYTTDFSRKLLGGECMGRK
jgi:hypothetical protein